MIDNVKNTIDGLIYFVENQGKSIVGNVFGFNETISKLEAEKTLLFDNFESLKIQMEIALENESSNKAKVEELQKLLDAGGKGMKERNYLPEVFEESSDVYKFGFWLKNSKGEKYLEPIDAGGHLTLTSFMYHIINKAKLTGKETALEAFNKILGAQQTYTTYTYDQDQWGANHGENWTPAIIVLNTKTDDCIAEYEEIYTKDGVCKIKDLTIGQEVLSYNFKTQEYEYKPIMNIWDKGKLNINRVHFRNGSRTIDVSEEHPFLVAKKGKTLFKKHETIAYEKVSLKNIDLEKWDKRKVPIATKIPYKIIDCPELTEDICKIIGHYIAEGWVIKSSKKRHRTYTSGYDITEEIIPILEKLNTPIREFKNKNGVPCIEFLNGNINTILQDIKDDSFNIHLPEKYFHLPENKIRALLNGYFIGDGHTDENSKWGRIRPNLKYRYSTSSEQWANDLCRLSFQIGEPLYCWKQLNHQGLGKKPIYRLSYCTSSEFVLNHGWKNIGEVSISQVEKLDKKVQMYDFEVADNHNFVFTNGVISHNCESLSSLAVSAFEYYRVIENKFPEAYAFVGTGYYNWKNIKGRCGHGFPCLYIKDASKKFEECLFIGESTIHSARPVKPLTQAKDMYDLSWGCNSFWHDFRLKKEHYWWLNSTAGVQATEPSFEEKQKMINKFWGVKS